MGRIKLPRIQRECGRDSCHNTFEVALGAKYQKRYCSPKCAAIATKEARRHRHRKRTVKELSPKVRDILKKTRNSDPWSILVRIKRNVSELSPRQLEELGNRYLELLVSQ